MVDVIIPTYQPDDDLIRLFDSLRKQSLQPGRIIIVNTEEGGWDAFCFDHHTFRPDDYGVEVHHISKNEFDHGRTRNWGVKKSEADFFVLMTQDAIPANEHFLERLVAPLSEEGVACSYARQLPKSDADITEQITRRFNYPSKSIIKSKADIDRLGIKTYFCSNVSCAYNREIFNKLGGFINRTIFNEDMIYAAKAINAGYRVAYAADARVFHSHNYGAREQFHRNVDLGVSQAEHPEIFDGLPSEGEGKKLVKATVRELRRKAPLKILPYIYVCGCRYLGYLIGKNYRRLPKGFVKRCSMSPRYFE